MDRPQNRNLRRGGPGRPKGSRDRRTLAITEFARSIIESDEYRNSLRARVLAGKAPHLEPLLYHYGYGKPVERVELSAGKPISFEMGLEAPANIKTIDVTPAAETSTSEVTPITHSEDKVTA